MEDTGKTKEQLLEELAELRQRVGELEEEEVERERIEREIQESAEQGVLLAWKPQQRLKDRDEKYPSQSFNYLEEQIEKRMADLEAANKQLQQEIIERKQTEEQLEENDRLLKAYHQIGRSILSTLNLDEILKTLAEQIVMVGIFRSLAISLVDDENRYVEQVLGLQMETSGIRWYIDEPPPRYPLDDRDILAEAARTGEMQIAEGWDDRFTLRPEMNREGFNEGHVVYFIPVKQQDRIVAVLATGSTIEEKESVLHRIESMEPLLDQVAIALEHAELYRTAQEEITERKQGEEALRESEENYRRLIEINPHIIYQLDTNGVITFISKEISEITGYEADELIGKNIVEIMHKEDWSKIKHINERRTGKRGTKRLEFRLMGKDKPKEVETLWVGVNATGVYENGYIGDGRKESQGEATQFLGTHGTITDITQRRKTEEITKVNLAQQRVRNEILQMESEEDWNRVKTFFHRELDQLMKYDGLGINFIDRQNETFVAYPIDSDQKRSYDFLPISLQYAIDSQTPVYRRNRVEIEQFGDALGSERNSVVDVPFRNGTIAVSSNTENAFSESDIHILSQFAPVMSEGHRRVEDITQRKQAENTLEQEYRLRDADSAIRLAVASINEPKNIEKVLAEVSSQLTRLDVTHDGCSLQIMDTEGTNFFSVGSGTDEDSDWRSFWDRLQFVAQDGTVSFREDASIDLTEAYLADISTVIDVWKNGTFRYDPCAPEGLGVVSGRAIVDVAFSHGTLAINSKQPHAFGDEDIAYVQRFAQIISEGFQRFLYINERKQMEEELIRTQRLRAVGELSAGVSHNLNNILTGILMPAQLLKLTTDDPQIHQEVDEIVTYGQRAKDLVHRLHLSVRGIEEDRLQPISVNEIIQEAIQIARPKWKDGSEANGITIEMVTALKEVPFIRGTGSRLHDILTNLIFNATDAMSEGGTITIQNQVVEEFVQLTFSDTGIGMEEETRKRVFEPFFTTKMDIGTGLGLSTVFNTVTQWGGTIAVESTPGEGTTFILQLPVWKEEIMEKQAERERFQVRPGKVLVIDDDQGICSMLSRLLGQVHEVETNTDGRQALEEFVPGYFDVVLLDLGMSGLSGNQVAQEILHRDPLVSTVLITGWELSEDDPRRAPFDFQIAKPFDDLDEISNIVTQAIELHDERVGT